ncbi:Imm1 family immunity protein [Streptomyces pseudogriseolus]|uniref:Imm1 family immunity protein n=1 Tax=Streptomyces pseudogriseolus TaxID=36817 RepID=UPI00346F8FA5
MIIEFWINGEMKRVSKPQEVEIAIYRALNELESEREVPVGFDPGSTGAFHVFDLPEEGEVPAVADNSLTVGVNRETGYGGLIWWGEEIPEDPDQFYWVSHNSNPPSFDPRVTADPGYPLWFNQQNVVSLEKVEAALREFCFNQGKRPTVVDWEPSTVNGQPLES